MIALQTVLPYTVTRCLSLLERRLQREEGVSPEHRTRLLNAIPIIRHMIAVMHRCHLVAFYMNGLFYHMAKRLMGIYYVSKCSTHLRFFADFTAMFPQVFLSARVHFTRSWILRVNLTSSTHLRFPTKVKRYICWQVGLSLHSIKVQKKYLFLYFGHCLFGPMQCGWRWYMDQRRSALWRCMVQC